MGKFLSIQISLDSVRKEISEPLPKPHLIINSIISGAYDNHHSGPAKLVDYGRNNEGVTPLRKKALALSESWICSP